MTAFERAWAIFKGQGDITSQLDRILSESERKGVAQMNYDATRANPMVWDEDPSVMFPRECNGCPSLHTIHNWLEGMPTEEGGKCSICLEPWIRERIADSMEMSGMFGDGTPFNLEEAIQGNEIATGIDYGRYEERMRDFE